MCDRAFVLDRLPAKLSELEREARERAEEEAAELAERAGVEPSDVGVDPVDAERLARKAKREEAEAAKRRARAHNAELGRRLVMKLSSARLSRPSSTKPGLTTAMAIRQVSTSLSASSSKE